MKIINAEEFTKEEFDKLIGRRKSYQSSIENSIKEIINQIRKNGDNSLLNYIKKFDKIEMVQSELEIHNGQIQEAYDKVDKDQLRALKFAADNIFRFHSYQKDMLEFKEKIDGSYLGQIARPLNSIGIYSPGGRNPYPSSVLMCAIPAKVAGVKKIIICTPPNEKGEINPAILIAADLSGADKIYKIGGAHAIAAMAYGTETIPAVDKIVGPGNIFVTTAKLLVSRDVAIDLPAGPTELTIVADNYSNPRFIASDMLAQAEHDPNSLVVLLTTSEVISKNVLIELEKQKKFLLRKEIIENSLSKNGFIIIVKNLNEAIDVANKLAPEHLEIFTRKPSELLNKVENAGAVFLGEYSPVTLGDYTAGTNHVLPTGGSAKIYSGLSIRDFIKTISYLNCSKTYFNKLAEATITLAKMEGLEGHACSIIIRRDKK